MNPQKPEPTCQDPYEASLQALLNGEADARDMVILNDTLRIDPAARRSYIRAMAFEGLLGSEFAPVASPAKAAKRPSKWKPVAIAAAIAFGAVCLALIPRTRQTTVAAISEEMDDSEIFHAVITEMDEAVGTFDGNQLAIGLRLTNGLIELNRGRAEITFDSGAEVTLEGPARFVLENDNKSQLDTGKASAYVPEQARGFVIHTPNSYIRDLGTAFAVEVRDSQETDLHVLEGEVEVAPTGRMAAQDPQILCQQEAVRLADGSMLPIKFSKDSSLRFTKKNPPPVPPYVHWSLDSWAGYTTTDTIRGHNLEMVETKHAAAPAIVDGPFGDALHFDGRGGYARSDYPGVEGGQPRTIACWIRVEATAPENQQAPNGIIAWGVNRSAAKWQLAWNRNQAQGTYGAPRIEFGSGFAVGSTDLRDNRWHHLAIVFFGGPNADVATHIRIYVDGKLEPLTGRKRLRVNTDTASANAQPLILGRYLGVSKKGDTVGYKGDIDEIHVFEGPLLPKQIVYLMKSNSVLPQPK